jgi:phosphoribosyl 1,2-cyclic phosphate phosphodiesterase
VILGDVLTFLGTAAAEGYPCLFCRCDNCERARRLGGRSLRLRSSALVNDDLLIDLGPDVLAASLTLGRSLAGVRWCLQTHAHRDHLDTSHLLLRAADHGLVGAARLELWASPATLARVAADLPADHAALGVALRAPEPLRPFVLGLYRVTAYPTDHAPGALLYAIEGGGGSLFYGTDTAALPEATWRALRDARTRFDVVVLDHTYGPGVDADDHLTAGAFAEHVRRLREEGLLAHGGRVLAHHIAHDSNPAHPDLAELAARAGYEVAYDGLVVAP